MTSFLNIILASTLGGENEGDNESVQGQGFSENENKNHSHKDLILLCICSHTSVTDDPNSQSGSLGLEVKLLGS